MTTNEGWTGRVLARRFQIREPLGRGGMAEVYLAFDTRLGRNVAVKILRTDVRSPVDIGARLLREARTIAQIVHPHVVSVYDVIEQGGVIFIIMELLVGRGIDQLLTGSQPLGAELVLEISRQVASALIAAHRLGVVHRDVKPENIFLLDTHAGILAKLLDFSLARVQGSEDTQRLARKGIIVGTPHYMAPEQITASNVGPSTDLYALGVVMFEMLTGRLPYVGENSHAILLAHRGADIPRVEDHRDDLPMGLSDLVFEMMQKRPLDRPANADVVVNRLSAMLLALKEQALSGRSLHEANQNTRTYGRRSSSRRSVSDARKVEMTMQLGTNSIDEARREIARRTGKPAPATPSPPTNGPSGS